MTSISLSLVTLRIDPCAVNVSIMVECLALPLRIREVPGSVSTRRQIIQTGIFCEFPQSLKLKVMLVP
jgi:hypothetical protein